MKPKNKQNKNCVKTKTKIYTKADPRLLFLSPNSRAVLSSFLSSIFPRKSSLLFSFFLSLTTNKYNRREDPLFIYFSLRSRRDSLLLRRVNPFSVRGCCDPPPFSLGFVLPSAYRYMCVKSASVNLFFSLED